MGKYIQFLLADITLVSSMDTTKFADIDITKNVGILNVGHLIPGGTAYSIHTVVIPQGI